MEAQVEYISNIENTVKDIKEVPKKVIFEIDLATLLSYFFCYIFIFIYIFVMNHAKNEHKFNFIVCTYHRTALFTKWLGAI